MERLLALAEERGLYVAHRPLRRIAYYMHSERLIVLNSRKGDSVLRSALAHELGHAHYAHGGSCEARDELLADQYAARLLIAPDAYAAAEAMVGDHPGALARELGVTRRLVELRREDFAREARNFAVVDEWRGA